MCSFYLNIQYVKCYFKITVQFVVGYKLSPVQQFYKRLLKQDTTYGGRIQLGSKKCRFVGTVVQETTCNQQRNVLQFYNKNLNTVHLR
jgi:hypothetical protein